MHCIILAFACLVSTVNGRRTQARRSNFDLSSTKGHSEKRTALQAFLLGLSPTALPMRRLVLSRSPVDLPKHYHRVRGVADMSVSPEEAQPTSAFRNSEVNTNLKMQLLTLAANLDRGQSYNPTSSDAYKERMDIATQLIRDLIAVSPPLPTSLDELDGEWELAFTNVAHGIFRSSPFFLAIQEAYANADPPAPEKAQLFFKLHELQTCSWGVSKIGRVAQTIDAKKGMIYSEFDTNLFALTVIPILGWFKLLPTFGGSVITASSAKLVDDRIDMEVEYTTSRPVNGLSGLRPVPGDIGKKIAESIWNLRVPVKPVWKLLPWNKGRGPICSVKLVYYDGDIRIVEDSGGEFFVYTRPIAPRPLPADK